MLLLKINSKYDLIIFYLHIPQLDSPSPNNVLYKLCIQNASQTHTRVSSSHIPCPII